MSKIIAELEIKRAKNPILIRIFLFVIAIICFFIPLSVLAYRVYFKEGLHISVFISFAFFWTVVYFFIKMILWNTFGKETIQVSDKEINYSANYKYFISERKISLEEKDIKVSIISEEAKNPSKGTLRFTNENNEKIETVLLTKLDYLEEFKNKIDCAMTK